MRSWTAPQSLERGVGTEKVSVGVFPAVLDTGKTIWSPPPPQHSSPSEKREER